MDCSNFTPVGFQLDFVAGTLFELQNIFSGKCKHFKFEREILGRIHILQTFVMNVFKFQTFYYLTKYFENKLKDVQMIVE